MPTSVLLAVLAAAGLLALAPALVRRYDATERLVAERASSTARVLQRNRRRRSVPGRYPVNTTRVLVVTLRTPVPNPASAPAGPPAARAPRSRAAPGSGGRGDVGRHGRVARARSHRTPPHHLPPRPLAPHHTPPRPSAPPRRRPPRRYAPAVYRRRRVLAALVMLNLAELSGVVAAGPGFWSGFAVTAALLTGYLVHLRNLAIADRRRQRALAREAAWLAARQAEVRREQARRAAARREIQRRLAEQREAVRRAAQGHRPSSTAGGGGVTSASYSYRRAGGMRGRPYQAGPSSSAHSA